MSWFRPKREDDTVNDTLIHEDAPFPVHSMQENRLTSHENYLAEDAVLASLVAQVADSSLLSLRRTLREECI